MAEIYLKHTKRSLPYQVGYSQCGLHFSMDLLVHYFIVSFFLGIGPKMALIIISSVGQLIYVILYDI